jgi:hypothetical protein
LSSGQYDYFVLHQNGRNRTLDFKIANDGSGFIELDFDSGAQQTVVFASGGTYITKWHYTEATGISEAKVWNARDTEPAWQVTENYGPGDGAATGFRVGLQSKNPSSGFTYTHSIDFIEFDYAGKPCYISCPEIDYTVYPLGWVQTPGVYCAVVEGVSGNQRTCQSDGLFNGVGADPLSMVYLYGGATYDVHYEVVHSYDSMGLVPSLFEAGRTGLIQWQVGTGAAADCWLWPVPNPDPATQPIGDVTIRDTTYRSNYFGALLGSSMCCCGTNYGSSMTGYVRYVSGPDPRFEGLAAQPCVPISSATGQPAPSAGASGTQTGARINSTTYEVWVPFVPGTATVWLNGRLMRLTYDYTEDPAGARIYFVLPVDVNDVVYITYIAAGPATTSSWLPGSV